MKKILSLVTVTIMSTGLMTLVACGGSNISSTSSTSSTISTSSTSSTSSTIESKIFLGKNEITQEGKQNKLSFPNISYKKSTNTLTILPSVFKYSECGIRNFENIYLGDSDEGPVSFLFSYSGSEDLNIEFLGDCKFINDSQTASEFVGAMFVENDVDVHIKGPGYIETFNVNHSVLYGKNAFVGFEDILVQSSNNVCCFGIACDQASFNDCNVEFEVESYGYSGFYIPNGTYDIRTHFNVSGFEYGYYVGSTFMYEGCTLEAHKTKTMAANFYALQAYNSNFVVYSDSAGIACFDGADFYNCKGYVYADCLYAINSLECTILFNNCEIEAVVNSGIGIQAWRNIFIDSSIKVKSVSGFGINSEYNAAVEEGTHPGIYISNSYIDAKGSICAIYSVADLELVGSTLTNEQKILGQEVEIYEGFVMKAICEKTETELVLDSSEELRVYPSNGAVSVIIEKVSN